MAKKKIDLHEFLYQKIMTVLNEWDYSDVYSISFFVYSNEAYEYKGYSNISTFEISCNKETYFQKTYEWEKKYYEECGISMDTRDNGRYSETRWNYASLEMNEVSIFHDEEYDLLFEWYKQEGIDDIGYEAADCYDENMRYIGKGPRGYYELLQVITAVAKRIQEEDYFLKTAGKRIPIIIQDYELTYYVVDATIEANVHNEAADFLEFIKSY